VNWQEYIGVLHVHSRYSDGSGSISEIIDAAHISGLDFVVLSDHDTLAAQREGWQKKHDGMMLLVATEITPKKQGHVLAMNVDHCEGYAAQHNESTLDDIAAQGGYAMIAHPMGTSKPSLRINFHPWYKWDHPAVRGLEVWPYLHDWVEKVAWWKLPFAYFFWRHPERCVTGPEKKVLKHWDKLGKTQRISGMSGLDCHSRRVAIAGVSIFPYEKMFSALRNHLFIDKDRWENDTAAALWEAHAEGRAFFSHDILASGTGTRCWAAKEDGQQIQMGEETEFSPGMTMHLRLRQKAKVRWIANGRPRITETTDELDLKISAPGVYRFEATLDEEPWLYCNPIYVRS